jgi:hypothetical protein
MNIHNIDCVNQMIRQKINYNAPFYATRENAQCVVTDMDHFPYKRFFRGVYNDSSPHIFEREAGFRVRQDDCYKLITTPVVNPVEFCWEFPCSNVKPCQSALGTKPCNNFIVPP